MCARLLRGNLGVILFNFGDEDFKVRYVQRLSFPDLAPELLHLLEHVHKRWRNLQLG